MRDLFYGGLLAVLCKSFDMFGEVWAWRITRLVHALPYLAAAFGFGWASTWFWGDPFPRMAGAWLCFGSVALCMAWDWFKDWRRG